METTKKLLGARIKELRKLRGLSQEKLAELVDIDPKHVSRIEVGGSYPSIDTLAVMAKSLQVELKDFFEFGHHRKKSVTEITKEISAMLRETDSEKVRLILKVVRSIVR